MKHLECWNCQRKGWGTFLHTHINSEDLIPSIRLGCASMVQLITNGYFQLYDIIEVKHWFQVESRTNNSLRVYICNWIFPTFFTRVGFVKKHEN